MWAFGGLSGEKDVPVCVHTPCQTVLSPTFQQQGYNKNKNDMMWSNSTQEDRKNATDTSAAESGFVCVPGSRNACAAAPGPGRGACLRGRWVASSGFRRSRTRARRPTTARHLPRARCRGTRVLRICWVSSWILETPPSLWLLWVPSWALATSSPPPLAPLASPVMLRSTAAHGCAERT